MKKKIVSALLTATMVCGMSVVPAVGVAAADDTITVGFSQVGAESDWRTANTESMKSTFSEENGYELIFDDAQQKQEIQQKQEAKKAEIEAVQKTIWNHQENGKRFQNMQVDFNEQLVQKENEFRQQDREKYEPEFQEYLEGRQSRNYEYLMRERIKKKQPLEDAQEKAYEKLVEARSAYLRKYPNRTYSATIRDNDVYEKQLSNLECDNLEKYREEAQEQARAAVEHFKVDFVSKIRYAIKEAYQKKDELNRIISRLDFGKDKYQFVITKNKGPDGRFYRMFMDDALDINPSQLSDHMENQMNLFTMEHEEEYGDLMNELIEIFIPPENATREELEEARKNMDKYADYRTYLSFDMQQIVQGEKDMRIGLSKMIKKNSGGEGQNPLYIALLASFAQIYDREYILVTAGAAADATGVPHILDAKTIYNRLGEAVAQK